MLRFAGGLHIVSGRIVVEAELDTGAAARRLRKDIAEIYGHSSDVVVVSGNGIRKGSRYVVRVVRDGEALARQTGLLDGRGRPVRGLPPQVVSGAGCDAVAAWRGAFLAHGSLTEPGRSSSLEVTCPGPEAALALVGAARRLGIAAKAREVRGVDRVVIRDGDAIGQAGDGQLDGDRELQIGAGDGQSIPRQLEADPGQHGQGTWTFFGGHDPEDPQHQIGDPPTDLAMHPHSPGYRLILNNVLFPAARKQPQKT